MEISSCENIRKLNWIRNIKYENKIKKDNINIILIYLIIIYYFIKII